MALVARMGAMRNSIGGIEVGGGMVTLLRLLVVMGWSGGGCALGYEMGLEVMSWGAAMPFLSKREGGMEDEKSGDGVALIGELSYGPRSCAICAVMSLSSA